MGASEHCVCEIAREGGMNFDEFAAGYGLIIERVEYGLAQGQDC